MSVGGAVCIVRCVGVQASEGTMKLSGNNLLWLLYVSYTFLFHPVTLAQQAEVGAELTPAQRGTWPGFKDIKPHRIHRFCWCPLQWLISLAVKPCALFFQWEAEARHDQLPPLVMSFFTRLKILQ